MHHFKIKGQFSNVATEFLENDLILLRIFSEIHEGKNIGYVPDIYKGDIFGNLPFVNLGQEPERATVLGNSAVKKIPPRLDPLQSEFEKLSATFRNLLVNIADGIAQTTESIHKLGPVALAH